MSDSTTEILVHIAAPSRIANDRNYRLLARAYLDFAPASRTHIITAQVPLREPNQTEALGARLPPSSQRNSQHVLRPPSWPAIESPQMSFGSAFGNLNSPSLARTRQQCSYESQSSWVAPPSVIQDSQPEHRLAIPQYCSPTRILEDFISGVGSSQPDLSPTLQRRAPAQAGAGRTPSVAGGQDASVVQPVGNDTEDGSDSEEDLPDTQPATPISLQDQGTVIPLSPAVSNKRRLPADLEPQSIIEETRIGSSFPVSSSRAESEPPTKRNRTSPQPTSGKQLARSSSDIGPQRQTPNASQLAYQNLDHLEVFPPTPPVSIQDLQPEDMITDVMAKLAHEMKLPKRYKPSSQTRELRAFERGFWLVDCRSWDEQLKQRAWGFITGYLSRGCAGWGTSCKRDRDFTWIRLYCWGCVAGHIYLLAYMMSEKRVYRTGTSWIGGDGAPVVVVGARSESKR